MFNTIVTFPKSGGFLQRPDWRYHVLEDPFHTFTPARLDPHVRTIEAREHTDTFHGSYLSRFLDRQKPETYRVNFRLSEEGRAIFTELSAEQKALFREQQLQRLRDEGIKRITCNKDVKLPSHRWQWRLKYLQNIKDEYLQKLIRHVTNVEFDEYIDKAVKLKESKEHEELIRIVGYFIYIGIPDSKISYKCRGPVEVVGVVRALRHLFFDFSQAPSPTETVANVAYLRQMVNNKIATEVEFNTYKLINTLGELGLRAKYDMHALNEVELKLTLGHSKKSVYDKLLFLDQSARTAPDARQFITSLSSIIKIQQEQDQSNYTRARTDNVIATTTKIQVDLNANSPNSASTDDIMLALIDTVYESSMRNNPPPEIKSCEEILVKGEEVVAKKEELSSP